MATFTITTTQYVSDLVGKTGADTYNINGGSLIVDCDSRYAPNATATTGPFLNTTVSATLGGHHQITTEFTKMIPFNTGTGTVPAYGTVITQGTASGVLLCVMQERTGGLVYLPGSAMPAVGWIKLRVTLPGFTTGAFTGLDAVATGPAQQAWIEVVGQESGTCSYSRLGTMQYRGDWFEVGTINGDTNPTFQLPYFTDTARIYYPGVDVETSPGSGEYQFWPNVGFRMTAANCSRDTRSMFCTINTTGVVKFGGEALTSTLCGYSPTPGCKVRIPSIILQNCLAASRNQNVEPSRTMGTRMETNFSNAGPFDARIVTATWYFNVVQAYSVYVRDLHACDNVLFGECATAPDIDNLHVGLSTAGTEFGSNAIVFQQFYNGGTVGAMSWVRSSQTSTSAYPAILVNLYGDWTFGKLRGGSVGAPTAVAGALYWNTCGNAVIDEIKTFSKRILVQGADSLKIKKHVYADKCVGTTDTVAQSRAVETVGLSKSVDVTNIENWPDAPNSHPYLALMFCNTTSKATLRNCGTPAAPYNAGTVNTMGYIWDDGGNNDIIKVQRNWCTALRLGIHGGTNTTKRLISVNNYNADSSKTVGPQQLDSVVHGNRFNGGSVPTSYAAVYGNCMWDGFIGDTTSRAALIFVEKSAANPDAYVITGGTPKFTGGGALAMATTGDQITYTWPWRILGWTGLTVMAPAGTNQTTNHLYEYSLDKDGSGFGVWKTLSNTNLAAETGIDPLVGFIPRLRITCTVSSTANQITALRFDGTTTLALQNTALYPLDNSTLSLTGLVAGSSVAVFAGTPTPGQEPLVLLSSTTGTTATLYYEYNSLVSVNTVRIRKPGYAPIDLPYDNELEVTIPIAQQQVLDGYGNPIYDRGLDTTSAFVTPVGSDLCIDIGNTLCVAEDVYDVLSEYQATATGMRYPEALRFDGRDLLLMNGWLLRRQLAAYSSSGIDASVVVNGSTGSSPDNEVNGSVDIRARAVRTFDTSNTGGGTPPVTMTEASIAAAVRAELSLELSRLDIAVSTRSTQESVDKAVSNSALAAALSA